MHLTNGARSWPISFFFWISPRTSNTVVFRASGHACMRAMHETVDRCLGVSSPYPTSTQPFCSSLFDDCRFFSVLSGRVVASFAPNCQTPCQFSPERAMHHFTLCPRSIKICPLHRFWCNETNVATDNPAPISQPGATNFRVVRVRMYQHKRRGQGFPHESRSQEHTSSLAFTSFQK